MQAAGVLLMQALVRALDGESLLMEALVRALYAYHNLDLPLCPANQIWRLHLCVSLKQLRWIS